MHALRRAHLRVQQSARPPCDGAGLHESPGEPREHQRDGDLYGGEQEGVVLGTRIRRRFDVTADVDSVRQRAPRQLRDQDEQRERESRQKRLVAPRSFHPDSLRSAAGAGQTCSPNPRV